MFRGAAILTFITALLGCDNIGASNSNVTYNDHTTSVQQTISCDEDEAKPNKDLSVTLNLADGSRIIGIPSISTISFRTEYAELKIPLNKIDLIKIDDNHKKTSFDLSNGDKLKGTLDLNSINLSTVFGKVSIDTRHIIAIRVNQGTPTGPLLHYSFDHNRGTQVTDKSGKSHHGEVHGAKWVANGKVGGAYNFLNSYISAGDIDDLELMDKNMSFSAWFKTTNTGNKIILSKHSTTMPFRGYTLFIGYGGKVCVEAYELWPATGLHLTTPEAIYADGEWHLAVVVFNREKQKLLIYVDGVEQAHNSITNIGKPNSEPGTSFQVGRRGTRKTEFFDGTIDEVMVWNRTLSAEEIKEIYDLQK